LRTVSQIKIIAEIKDPSVFLKMGAEIHPDLVLLDASTFGEELLTAINKIKEEWSQTQCIVLVEDSQCRQLAYDAGADLVLSQDFPAAKLVALIEDLLIQNTQDETLANSEGSANACPE